MAAALPYEEPGIVTIVVLSSFLLLLNIVNYVLDNIIYCGLLGQIVVGVAWTQASFMNPDSESLIVQLGYLGLILLVYEGNPYFRLSDRDYLLIRAIGGLSTSFSSLKANLALSIAVAITGIGLPIALSYVLQELVGASPLQAFSAGAALCSTSLATTFTVLGTCGLTNTRLGTVLTTAAMLDDVVGLIMVQVISNLGTSTTPFGSIVIVRPIVVSVGLVIVLMLACRLFLKPLTIRLNRKREQAPSGNLQRWFTHRGTAFLIHAAILLGFVTGATYAGTSNLFAAYLAGASITWWDSEVPHNSPKRTESTATSVPEEALVTPAAQQMPLARALYEASTEQVQNHRNGLIKEQTRGTSQNSSKASENRNLATNVATLTGKNIYQNYYGAVVDKVLKPFFFVSEGKLSLACWAWGPILTVCYRHQLVSLFPLHRCSRGRSYGGV